VELLCVLFSEGIVGVPVRTGKLSWVVVGVLEFFFYRDVLASQANLLEEALRQYDELETVYHELEDTIGEVEGVVDDPMLEDRIPGLFGLACPPSPSGGLLRSSEDMLPAPHVLDASVKPYREMIHASKISVFDFRHYLFARQCSLILQAGRSVSIAERALSFLRFMGAMGDRQVATGHVSPLVVDEWLTCAALDIVEVCHKPGGGSASGLPSSVGSASLGPQLAHALSGTTRGNAVNRSRIVGELLVIARLRLRRILLAITESEATRVASSALPSTPTPDSSAFPTPNRPHSAAALALRRALQSPVSPVHVPPHLDAVVG
jgi:hypothetical protein